MCGDQKIPALKQSTTVPGSAYPAQTDSLASKKVGANAVNNRSMWMSGEQEERAGQHSYLMLVADPGDRALLGI